MNLRKTKIEGLVILKPTIFKDKRGYFIESYNLMSINKFLGNINFLQDNESESSRGVLRGLHYQTGVHAQAKLVRIIEGNALDVVVDIRPSSETFGEHFSIELSGENKKQLFIPRGFAHGFIVLSDTAIFSYKCDNLYNKASEGGIIYNDPKLAIDWQLPEKEFIVSEKDIILPTLDNARL